MLKLRFPKKSKPIQIWGYKLNSVPYQTPSPHPSLVPPIMLTRRYGPPPICGDAFLLDTQPHFSYSSPIKKRVLITQCVSCSHSTAVPPDLNGGCDGEKLNDDPSSPDRLTHSVLAKEGEEITQAIF